MAEKQHINALSNRKKIVSNKKMTFFEKIYFPAIIQGLIITLSHFFKRKITIKYPEVKRPISDIYRGKHVLKRDDNGRERCTACGLCALSCPAEAITMIAAERSLNENHLYREEKYAIVYEINMLRCIFCGFCEEACPKEAIFLTNELIPAEYHREIFIFGKDKLLESVDTRINITRRQTMEVLEFKKDKNQKHNS
ncbi:MAG: NADH-quinone oxidoreductase subunit I [Bacteroidota bacterium]